VSQLLTAFDHCWPKSDSAIPTVLPLPWQLPPGLQFILFDPYGNICAMSQVIVDLAYGLPIVIMHFVLDLSSVVVVVYPMICRQ